MRDLVLRDREQRAIKISEWINRYHKALISVHANIPGSDKNIAEAYLIVRFFRSMILEQFAIMHHKYYESWDGPYVLMVIESDDLDQIKEKLIRLESSSFGRLIDLDLWSKDHVQYTRKMLHLSDRTCYICGDVALHCVRSQKHSPDETLHYVIDTTKEHLKANLTLLIKKAMMTELNLEHKFGLVTPTSQGSHHDMNFNMMMQSQDVIIEYFIRLFELGYTNDHLHYLFDPARQIGLEAEKAMLQASDGINCYKGLIFILGLVMVALGYTLKQHGTIEMVFSSIQSLSITIFDDFRKKPQTPGEHAYFKHQMRGARGEAYLGLPSVHQAFNLIKDERLTDQVLRKTLKQLILSTEDTVFLKRARSFENYLDIKEELKHLNVDDLDQVIKFTQRAIEQNLSFGGSADLLIATLFLKDINAHYF